MMGVIFSFFFPSSPRLLSLFAFYSYLIVWSFVSLLFSDALCAIFLPFLFLCYNSVRFAMYII
jgi:hypothetical protein